MVLVSVDKLKFLYNKSFYELLYFKFDDNECREFYIEKL